MLKYILKWYISCYNLKHTKKWGTKSLTSHHLSLDVIFPTIGWNWWLFIRRSLKEVSCILFTLNILLSICLLHGCLWSHLYSASHKLTDRIFQCKSIIIYQTIHFWVQKSADLNCYLKLAKTEYLLYNFLNNYYFIEID